MVSVLHDLNALVHLIDILSPLNDLVDVLPDQNDLVSRSCSPTLFMCVLT
jgi:hypothetical protein